MTMSHTSTNTPVSVLVFAGLDPTGGAGITADIETLSHLKVHPLSIVTCLTVQDTNNVKQVTSVDAALIKQQLETLQHDIAYTVIKLGLLSSIEIIEIVSEAIKVHPSIPIVFDPILRAGGGANLNNGVQSEMIQAMREKIIPYTTVITPNSLEARLLSNEDDLNNAANAILALGCKHCLITGEHENDPANITNTFYSLDKNKKIKSSIYHWPRLANQYHGSGCTLASAISAHLATGASMKDAVQHAQTFTNQALKHAVPLGQGQLHPYRFI